jgi:branched-chain amino acid transport system substrate-binding protein
MRRARTAALFALLTLTGAACSSNSADTTAAAPAETAAATEPAAVETTAATATETAAATATETAAATAAAAGSDCKLDKPLKVGFAADFDLGGISDKPASDSAKYIFDELNKKGGVGGQKVEFTVKQISQTPPDPAAAQRAIQELVDSGVSVLLGPPFTDYGLPVLEITNGKIPVLFVGATEVGLADVKRGSFLVSFNDKMQGSAAAEYSTKQGFKTAVTMSSQEIPYLNVPQAAFKEVFEGAGGKVEKDLSFKLGLTDFSAQVNEIAGMSKAPDVIYSSFFQPEAGIFLKQLRQAGVKSTVFGADGFDASLIWSAGADAEGVLFTSHTFPGPGNRVQEFLDGYNAAGGPKIETVAFGALGADAAQLATAATLATCSTDPAKILTALSNLTADVTTGTTSYAGTDGNPKRNVTILTVKDGKPVGLDAFFPKVVAK